MKTANLNRNKFLNNLLNIFTLFCQKQIAVHYINNIDAVTIKY